MSARRVQRQRRLLARRRRERGAATLIVILVLTMLAAVGLFAARSAALATKGSGYQRQLTQTHYMTEYAFATVLTELSSDRREAYVKAMANSPTTGCAHDPTAAGLTADLVPNYTCYRFGYGSLDAAVAGQPPGQQLLEPLDTVSDPNIPGSLGLGDLDSSLNVELADLAPSEIPVAGMDATGSGGVSMRYYSVTINAAGQVRPFDSVGGAENTALSASASVEFARGHLLVGPLPQL